MKTLKFEYRRDVNLPQRLAGAVGQTRDLPETDARRLAADGYGQIVTAPPPKPVAKPAAKPTASAEADSK